MNKLKKSLSIILTLVMLFTIISSGLSAFAATSFQADSVVIAVPETVYMIPSTGESKTGQYYVNNTINNANGTVTTEANAANTKGYVQLLIPDAKSFTITVNTITSGIGDIVLAEAGATSGSHENTSFNFGTNGTSGWFDYDSVGFYINGTGISAGGTALAEWIFTVTMNDGSTRVYYAYSVLYAPWYQPVGAASKAVGSNANVYSSSILWVQGVHGYSDGSRANSWYVQTANFLPMLGAIKSPGNNNPDTNWIQSGSNGLSPTMAYNVITESGTKYHARANTISPTANITVDTSRYNNFNQIPNFKVGFMITDHENAAEGSWYVSDYGTNAGSSYYNGTDRSGSRYDDDYNDTGTIISGWSNSADYSCGIKVNQQSWNKGVTGTASFRLKAGVYAYKKSGLIKSTSWNNDFVNISVTGTDKNALRQAVIKGTSLNANNYTADTFNAYKTELRNAALALGNPTATTTATDNLTSKLNALKTNVYFNGNGGSVSAASDTFVIGGNNTAAYTATATATRAGYTFKGWATTPNATTGSTSLTLGFNQTLYAVWQPKIVFDNLIDLKEWKALSPSNATVSDFTDTGFTLTSNEGVGEGSYSSPFFPVEPGKSYTIDIDFEGTDWDVYIFFCNEAGTWIDFSDGASNRFSTTTTWGNTFTAPDKAEVVKAQIRVDANGSNNTVKFDNIRVYEEGKVQDDIPYFTSQGFDYGSVYGDKLPTPTKYGYVFKGWVDENGNAISSSAAVDFMGTKYLYSKWEIGTYTLTFDADGGSAVAPITQQYDTAVTAPQNPTKTGYTFSRWDKEIPAKMPGENITYKALWNANTYTVSFNANSGEGSMADITATYDQAYTLPANTFTKEGYTFAGWSRSADGEIICADKGEIINLTSAVNGNVTLYAVWTINQYTITYDALNGTQNIVQTYDYNEAVTAPAEPTKEGYTFKGWAELPSNMPANNITVTAIWEANKYTITFDTDGGTSVAPITQDYNTDVTAPQAPTKEGYTFAGWDTEIPSKMPATNMTIKATWTENNYTISYNANGGVGSVDSQEPLYTNTVVIRDNAFTKTGYHFIGWATSENGDVTYTPGKEVSKLTAVDGGVVTLYAVWEQNTYKVVFLKNDAEATGTMEDQTFTYDADEVSLSENKFVKTGYHFVGWATSENAATYTYTDKESVKNLTAEENGTVTLYAVWEINRYTVTFKFYDKDGDMVTVSTEGVPHGTAFDTLIPDDDERFTEIYYNGKDTSNTTNTHHYEFTAWANEVDVITSDSEFVAVYETNTESTKHSYSHDYINSVQPTCESNGVNIYYCSVCGFTYSEIIVTEGHKWTETGNTATCTEGGYKTMICTVYNCGKTGQMPSDPLGHTDGEWKVTSAPKCTTTGTESHYCGRCNVPFETKDLDASGHTFESYDANEPDCVNDGNEAYKYCTVCELYFSDDADTYSTEGKQTNEEFILKANGHDTVFHEADAPSCTEDGNIAYYSCNNCSLYFEDEDGKVVITDIVDKKTGHDYTGEWVTKVEPGCETIGQKQLYCKTCGENIASGDIPATGHAYVGTVTEPTCTEQGYTTYVCSNDRTHTYVSDYVDALEHSYTSVVTPPTCTDKGFTTYTCIRGDHTYVSDYVNEKGHTPGEVIIENNVPATCTENGSYDEATYCTVCGFETSRESKVNVAPGHTPGEVIIENNVPATCTENGSYDEATYCTVCGFETSRESKVNVAPGHQPAKKQETITEASCTVAGDYWDITYCSVCSEELGRSKVTGQTLPHTYEEEIIDEAYRKSVATCTLYAVYYYDCIYCTANAKDAADKDNYTFEYVSGGYDNDNHVGTTTTRDENIVPGTCDSEKTWDEVTRCDDCNGIITSTPKTGDRDALNHVGGTYKQDENIVPGTCTSEKTWDEVTYCSDCDTELGRVDKIGEKDSDNHATEERVLKDDKAATCCEEGYSGNYHCKSCDAVVTYGTVISTTKENHAGGTRTEKEDTVPGTCVAVETWNDVTYCVGCGDKLSTVAKTGENDGDNHTGNNTVNITNEVGATCATPNTWTEVTVCECGETIKTENKTGTTDPNAHTGETYKRDTNVFDGDCMNNATWTEVTYCKGCDIELDRESKTGEKNSAKHTGNNETKKENVVAGTCVSEETWDDVTYCECGEKLSTVHKTGEKNAANHTGTPTKIEGYRAPTCKVEGYTGDKLYTCCDVLYEAGTAIATVDHTPADAVIENNVPATCTENGSYDEVVYCSVCGDEISSVHHIVSSKGHTPADAVIENNVPATDTQDGHYDSVIYCSECGHEISRNTIVVRPEREITFILHGETIIVKAYLGDTVTAPTVPDYTDSTGFIHKFKAWDKPITVVSGKATYTAVYTEPCIYTELDKLEEMLDDILNGGYADENILAQNKEEIDNILKQIEDINKDRNTRDKSEQKAIDIVVGNISDLIDIIYPDADSTLVINGSAVQYVGGVIDLKAVKMPVGTVISDAVWTSSDEDVVFISNGKIYAVATGTVTLTATKGKLTATKVITVVSGGNIRGINFTSIDKTHFIVEDYYAVYNSAILYWSNDQELHFRVKTYQNFMFSDYIVYINGVEAVENEEGYYVIPAGSGDVRVTIAGAIVEEDGSDGEVVTKWSFWEWILNFFRKIADFFKNIGK